MQFLALFWPRSVYWLKFKIDELWKWPVLTLRGLPGRASVVSPAPWRSSRAPSSSGNQPPSEEDSLPPWSWERGGEGAEERGAEEEDERKCGQKPADISDVSPRVLHSSPLYPDSRLTCGLCEPCQRHRWRKRLRVWTEKPWRSRSAPGRP